MKESKEFTSIGSSCLWGFANAIASEHPEYWGGIVDLPQTLNERTVEHLLQAMTQNNGEDRIKIEPAGLLVPRLQPTEIDSSNRLKLDPKGAYIITGGLGSLGLQTARFLVEKGAKRLILVGRSQPEKATEANRQAN